MESKDKSFVIRLDGIGEYWWGKAPNSNAALKKAGIIITQGSGKKGKAPNWSKGFIDTDMLVGKGN